MIPFDFQDSEAGPLAKLFRRLRDTLGSLADVVTNDRLVRVTFALATTDVAVLHGVGAPVRTWEIVDKDADANVWRSATVNNRLRDTIILQASAPVTVLIRFT